MAGEERKEVLRWLHKRIARLERELKELYAIRALLEGVQVGPGEALETSIKVGNETVASIVRGENYVRAIFTEPQGTLPLEVRDYLVAVEDMLRQKQRGNREGEEEARRRAEEKYEAIYEKVKDIEEKLKEEKLVRLSINEREIRFENISSLSERLHAKEALSRAVRLLYLLKAKAQERE